MGNPKMGPKRSHYVPLAATLCRAVVELAGHLQRTWFPLWHLSWGTPSLLPKFMSFKLFGFGPYYMVVVGKHFAFLPIVV